MKIICNREKLLTALTNVSLAVPSQSTFKEITGVLVSTVDGAVTLTGNNLSMGIVCTLQGEIGEEGSVIIPVPFPEIIRRCKGSDITITANAENLIHISDGNAEFDLYGFNGSEYPELPVFVDEHSLELPQTVLKKMIKQTVFAVSNSEIRPVQQGVLFEVGEGLLTLVALDGFRMAVSKEKISEIEKSRFIVPGRTLQDLSRMLTDTDVVKLSIGKNHACFIVGDCRIYTRLITQGEFINYTGIIPTSYNTSVKINTRELIEGVERVSLLADNTAGKRMKNSIIVRFSDGITTLGCSTMAGRAQDRIACEKTGNDIEIGINNNYVLDALRAAETDEVVIRMTTTFAAIKIVPPNDDSFIFLVMPVRTKSDEN